MSDYAEFQVFEGDEFYAEASGPREAAWREALNYASQVEMARIDEVTRRGIPAPWNEVPPSAEGPYAEKCLTLLRCARSEIPPVPGETLVLCQRIDELIGAPACDCASPNGTLHDVGCSAYYPPSILDETSHEIGTGNAPFTFSEPVDSSGGPIGADVAARQWRENAVVPELADIARSLRAANPVAALYVADTVAGMIERGDLVLSQGSKQEPTT